MNKFYFFLLSILLGTGIQLKSQNNYIRAHNSGAVNRVTESYFWHRKIYFITRQGGSAPMLNICDSTGVLIRAVNLPSTSSSVGNVDFKDGNFLYATQNAVHRLDSLGNVIWVSYVASNCTGGGFIVRSKFIKNGGVIVYGCSYGNLSILKLNPANGNLLGVRIINVNSAHPFQVPGNSQNFWAQDVLEISNSTIYFLLTRRDQTINYSENYVVKCTNDSDFIALRGISLDNVVTNNNNTNTGRLSHLQLVSGSLVVSGVDFDVNTSDFQMIKLDTNLSVVPIRYAKKAKAIGINFYSTLASVSNNNGKIYVGVTTSPSNCEASLMSFDSNFNFLQWTGYDLDNQACNYGYDCSIPMFKDPTVNLNKIFAVVSYSNTNNFGRSVIKTDVLGHMSCGIVLTPTLITDSLHSDSVGVFSQASSNGTSSMAVTSTLLPMYNDSAICADVDITSLKEQLILNATIYPNPASNLVRIESDRTIKEIEIIENTGRKVFSEEFNANSATLDIEKLKPGIYFLLIKGADGTNGRKLIKE
jgi:hypothetical protein